MCFACITFISFPTIPFHSPFYSTFFFLTNEETEAQRGNMIPLRGYVTRNYLTESVCSTDHFAVMPKGVESEIWEAVPGTLLSELTTLLSSHPLVHLVHTSQQLLTVSYKRWEPWWSCSCRIPYNSAWQNEGGTK